MTEEQQELVYSEFEEDLRKSAELATAERKGERQGERKAIITTAKAMLADGIDVGKIAKYTGLTKEEISALRK